jgi:DMSO/TMAO reductase YedYZ molybdopterin-dependent catalytic subunit
MMVGADVMAPPPLLLGSVHKNQGVKDKKPVVEAPAPSTTEDSEGIFKLIPDIANIQQKVAELMDDYAAVDETAGTYKKDLYLNGPDVKDQNTPDAWVPRNPWMNRLTGIHPFSAEPPLSLLRQHGFVTPSSVHYVRNHGLVPKLSWHDHKIDISGLVDRPMQITMAELVKLPTVTCPVTLQCAGNRRKEQNVIQRSIGFNWGCASASTAIWTGVPLRTLMEHVGMKSKEEGANWLNFVGPEGEVAQGDGSYGASHSRGACLNPARPCMLAFMMNGELLHPDHGFPVRLLMPGYIGGRMIKWLTKISVTKEEGENFYHINDNRVFPKHITTRDEVTKYNLWKDPSYIINDRNLNSAIWAPAHCEKVSLTQKTYRVGGYAYNGAGRPINRVEVTLNDGHTWVPAQIRRFEKPNEFGLVYCWVHWHVEIPVGSLRDCGEFAVCAWDDSQNCQPELPRWNMMGMMNNNWFRVKVHDVPAEDAIWFEHPTRVEPNLKHYWDKEGRENICFHLTSEGQLQSPGWMERLKDLVVAAHAPLPLEEQPLDGIEHGAFVQDLKIGEAGASGKPKVEKKKASNAPDLLPSAMSGDGTIANVGIKLDGKVQCQHCNQRFLCESKCAVHYKYFHAPNRHQED